ncbi:MAG: sulfite exporter TauE/SafE family protein [Spirochaetia bacterium]|nr:sulfite exporter TauE/SafE family protein [Spirochaetia bacterium]
MSILVIICASIGYAAESMFGFGGSIITFLLLSQSLPVKEAVSMLPVFALFGSLFIVLSDLPSVKWRTIGRICIYALPGLALGTLFMGKVPEQAFTLFMLAIIIAYGVNLIIGRDPAVPERLRKPLYAAAGFVIGATSLGVFFIPIIGSELGEQRSFRVSLGLLWTITAIFRIPLYMLNGVMTFEIFKSSLTVVPFLLIAILLGYYIHRMIPKARYKQYVGTAISAAAALNLLQLFPL